MLNFIPFAIFVMLAASSGAYFKPDDWYARLDKPRWNPPNWVFPVVWTPLYALIAVAGWMVWNEAGPSLVMVVWFAQLLLNGTWSWMFFGKRRMDWGMMNVSALWVLVALFIALAWPISMWAALMFAPYLVWVSAAALLNWQVWQMNKHGGALESQS
ncbi:TspO/MBR family protein [Rhodobium gokarnense]|uniref:Tryptophan-rich sensory protein n=1 Tax=Rhodobium gokarnense TaxID=364296 RepID=A0ABT3HBL6_9HYPH|nr:TspO/MBR family protein [Rhodobium gokarnense]MCW2307797.1 tryptophan-rich sensory protein [Rhodobium gokarnense]